LLTVKKCTTKAKHAPPGSTSASARLKKKPKLLERGGENQDRLVNKGTGWLERVIRKSGWWWEKGGPFQSEGKRKTSWSGSKSRGPGAVDIRNPVCSEGWGTSRDSLGLNLGTPRKNWEGSQGGDSANHGVSFQKSAIGGQLGGGGP